MYLQQAASPGKDGGVPGVDDHRVLENKTAPFEQLLLDTGYSTLMKAE